MDSYMKQKGKWCDMRKWKHVVKLQKQRLNCPEHSTQMRVPGMNPEEQGKYYFLNIVAEADDASNSDLPWD